MRRRLLIGIAAGVVILLVAAQLVLPRIAERRVRSELSGVATVSDVHVSSFPAVKLLFGDIDSLTASLQDPTTSRDQLGALIARTKRIDRLRIVAARARVAGLDLTDARLTKDGGALSADATVTREQLAAALPAGTRIDSLAATAGGLRVDGAFQVLGTEVDGPALVSAQDGAIVVSPAGGLLSALARLTVFSDPRVAVSAVRGRQDGDRLHLGADGRLL